jgi:hypothetical protein
MPKSIKKNTGNKKALQKELEKKIASFKNLPDFCIDCGKAFDKKSKEMAMSWFVIIKEEDVKLFCPDCQPKER